MSEKSLYEVLGVDSRAPQEEVDTAFAVAVEARRASRKNASDLHAAYAVIGDASLRRAYDMLQVGRATSEKLAIAKDVLAEAVPDIDWVEVREHTWQSALRVTVLVSGVTAKAADATAVLSRRVQLGASRRITTKQ